MQITDIDSTTPLAPEQRVHNLANEVTRMAATELSGELLVIVASGPPHLLDNVLGYTAPYQITCDKPTPMIAVAFPANDPEGAYARSKAENHPGLVVHVQSVIPADLQPLS